MSADTFPVVVVLGADPGADLGPAEHRLLAKAVGGAARTAGARVVNAVDGPLGDALAAAVPAPDIAMSDVAGAVGRVDATAGGQRVVVVLVGGDAAVVSALLDERARDWSILAVAASGGLAAQLSGDMRRAVPPVARGDDLARLRERRVLPVGEITKPSSRAERTHPTPAVPARFEHLIVWELDGHDVVKQVMARRKAYDQTAKRLQKNANRIALGSFVLGVGTVFLAVFNDQVTTTDFLHDLFRWLLVVMPAVIAALVAFDSITASGKRWLVVRSACEAMKRELFVWRTDTGIYAPAAVAAHPDAPFDATELLVDRIASIEAQMMTAVAAVGNAFVPVDPDYIGAASDDDGLSTLDADRYLRLRVDDQLDYYRGKIDRLRPQRRAYQVAAIASGAAGSVLAQAGEAIWLPVVFAIAAALGAYAKQRQLDTTLLGYARASASLVEIRTRWDAAPRERRDHARFERLVRDVENALELEQGNWAAQMKQGLDTALPQYEDLNKAEKPGMPTGADVQTPDYAAALGRATEAPAAGAPTTGAAGTEAGTGTA